MARPSIYEFAGGEQAFLALAAATHDRCMQDPELNHPFSHGVNPTHLEHLAARHARRAGSAHAALVLGRPAADVTPDLERALLRSMARIKMVEEADAEGPLAELYAASKSRSVARVVPDILRTMSLRPDFL